MDADVKLSMEQAHDKWITKALVWGVLGLAILVRDELPDLMLPPETTAEERLMASCCPHCREWGNCRRCGGPTLINGSFCGACLAAGRA